MRDGAHARGDVATFKNLSGAPDEIVERAMRTRVQTRSTEIARENGHGGGEGIGEPVKPSPVFHGRKVAMCQMSRATRDLALWAENDRLDIYLEQFRTQHGRSPSHDELLALMHGVLQGTGVEDDA